MIQRLRAGRSPARRCGWAVAPVVCAAVVGCCSPELQSTGEPPRPDADPWRGLPPLGQAPAVALPHGRDALAPPRAVQAVLPPLSVAPVAPSPSAEAVRVEAHPPLDGDPWGGIAFVLNHPAPPGVSRRGSASGRFVLDPPVPGALSWLGRSALVFLPAERFRFGTRYHYRLELPPALGGASGAARAVEGTFETRAPRLGDSVPWPGQRIAPAAPLWLRFDQPVEPAAVARRTRILDAAGRTYRFLAQPGETAEAVRLVPVRPLPEARRFRLILGPGIRGQEGPLEGQDAVVIPFETAGRARLVQWSCRPAPCRPGSAVLLEVGGRRARPRHCSRLVVEPPVAGLSCAAVGERLRLEGGFAAGQTYRFWLRPVLGESPGRLAPRVAAPPAAGVTLHVGRPRVARPAGFGRPLLYWPRGRPLSEAAPPAAQQSLRVAPLAPELLFPALRALAAADALAPLHLARAPVVPATRMGDAADRSAGLWLAALPPLRKGRVGRRAAVVNWSRLQVAARYGWAGGVALVARMPGGEPAAGAAVLLRDEAGQVRFQAHADARGLVRLPGPRHLGTAGPLALWAHTHGEAGAVLPLDGLGEMGGRVRGFLRGALRPPVERIVGSVLPDSAVVEPGGTVGIVGLLRAQTALPGGSLGHLPERLRRLSVQVLDRDGRAVRRRQVRLGADGLLRLRLRLPRTLPPGTYRLRLSPEPRRALAGVVEAALRVRLAVRGLRLVVTPLPRDPAKSPSVGFRVRVTSSRGRPVSAARVRWSLSRSPTLEPPPGYPGFRFGPEGALRRESDPLDQSTQGAVLLAQGEGRTDAEGQLAVHVDPPGLAGAALAAYRLTVRAETEWGARAERRVRLQASPRTPLLGLRLGRRVIRAGQDVAVQVVRVSARGAPAPGGWVEVVAESGEAGRRPVAVARCRRPTTLGVAGCRLRMGRSGAFVVRARAPGTMPAVAPLRVVGDATRDSSPGGLVLMADRERYREGDVAQVLVRSPRAQGLVLLVLEQRGVLWADAVVLSRRRERLVSVPLPAGAAPAVWLSATLLGGGPGPQAASDATDRIRLLVRRADAPLRVALGRPTGRPGADARLPVRVWVPQGGGAPASLLVWMGGRRAAGRVRRMLTFLRHVPRPGVALRASGFNVPAAAGAGDRWTTLEAGDRRGELGLEGTWPEAPGDGGIGGGRIPAGTAAEATGSPAPLRYLGAIRTDAQGRAEVPLGREVSWAGQTVVVLAADRNLPHRLGLAARQLPAAPKWRVQARLPETLRQGDRVQVSVRMEGPNRAPRPAQVLLRAQSLRVRPRRVRVPPGRTGIHSVTVQALSPGVGRLQVAARLGARWHAMEARTLVLEPAWTRRVAATAGLVQHSVRIPIRFTRVALPGGAGAPGRRLRRWVTLSLARLPWGALRPLVLPLLLQEHPGLGSASLRALALGLSGSEGPGTRAWLSPQAYQELVRRSREQLVRLRLPGGRFRRHPGSSPAPPVAEGLALLGLRRLAARHPGGPALALRATAAHLRQVLADPSAEPGLRARLVRLLRESSVFVPPQALQAVQRGWARLPLLDQACLLPVVVSEAPEPGRRLLARMRETLRRMEQRGALQARRGRVELRAHLLVADLAAGTGRRRITRDTVSLVRLLAQGAVRSPWTLAWALIAVHDASAWLAAVTGSSPRAPPDGRPPGLRGDAVPSRVTAWAGRQLLVSGTLRGPADALVRTLRLRGPAPAHVTVQHLGTGPAAVFFLEVAEEAPPRLRAGPAELSVRLRAVTPEPAAAPVRRGRRVRFPLAVPLLAPQGPAAAQGRRPSGGGARAAGVTLRQGGLAVVEVALVASESLPETVLRVPVPAGLVPVGTGWGGSASAHQGRLAPGLRSRFPPLPALETNFRAPVVWIHMDALAPGIYGAHLLFRASHAGRFGCPPAALMRASNRVVLATSGRCVPVHVVPASALRPGRPPGARVRSRRAPRQASAAQVRAPGTPPLR